MELANIIWRVILVLLYFDKLIKYILFTNMEWQTILIFIVGFYFIVVHQIGCWHYHYFSEWKPKNKAIRIIRFIGCYCLIATDWMGVHRK